MSKTDYPLDTIRGVVFDVDGVLSPSVIPMDGNGVPQRMVNIKDGYAMQLAVKRGLRLAIITGANTESICHRYNALGIKDVYLSASQKLPVLQKWMHDNSLEPSEVAYCGDDIPDIPCMQYVGLSVAPADADAEVRMLSAYVTDACGGYGVARELLEQVLRARGEWMSDIHAFGW